MSVGKGSIQRAAKAKGKKEEIVEAADMEQKETKDMADAEGKEAAVKTVPEKTAKTAKAAPKKKAAPAKKTVKKVPAKKPETVVAASVISSDDIHEKKFEAVSRIYCELPTYLL